MDCVRHWVLVCTVVFCVSSKADGQNLKHSLYGALPEVSLGYELDFEIHEQCFLTYFYGSLGFYAGTSTTNNSFVPVVSSFDPISNVEPYFSFGIRYYLAQESWFSPSWETFAQLSFDRGSFWNDLRLANIGLGVEHSFSKSTSFFLLNSIGLVPLRQFTDPYGNRMRGVDFDWITRVGFRYYFLST